MKKLMYLAVFALALGFTSCGSDDDTPANCRECTVLTIPISLCDNGDGTVTSTAAGQSETITLPEGITFEAYAETTCTAISIGF